MWRNASVLELVDRHVWGACAHKAYGFKSRHSHHISFQVYIRRCGGMADALASGASARKGVWVQVPPSAPKIPNATALGIFTYSLFTFHSSLTFPALSGFLEGISNSEEWRSIVSRSCGAASSKTVMIGHLAVSFLFCTNPFIQGQSQWRDSSDIDAREWTENPAQSP